MNAELWKCAAKVSYARRKLLEHGQEHYGSRITAYVVQLVQLQRENAELRAQGKTFAREHARQIEFYQDLLKEMQRERKDMFTLTERLDVQGLETQFVIRAGK